jgi:hypothetical protein
MDSSTDDKTLLHVQLKLELQQACQRLFQAEQHAMQFRAFGQPSTPQRPDTVPHVTAQPSASLSSSWSSFGYDWCVLVNLLVVTSIKAQRSICRKLDRCSTPGIDRVTATQTASTTRPYRHGVL